MLRLAESMFAFFAFFAFVFALVLMPMLGCAATPTPTNSPPQPSSLFADPSAPGSSVVPPTPVPEASPPPPPLPPPPQPAPPPRKPRTTRAADDLVEDLLDDSKRSALRAVMAAPETYRFQVLYSVVKGKALERHGFRADAEYFFPASSMKVPIALATYERFGALRASGRQALTRDASIRIEGGSDPTVTTLARETWRSLIVSDNFAANRMLAIVGHREAHETLWGLGLASARIRSGFATGAEIDPAEVSPRIEINANGMTDTLPARKSTLVLPKNDAVKLAIGKAAIVDGRRVEGPLSFEEKNAMRLRELQDTLVRIMRPDLLPPKAPPDTASKEDLDYLRQALGTLPSQSGLAGFDRNIVADYQLVPFLRGLERVKARGKLEIYSKVGQAFGFLIGNAYVVDKETGRAFFLTASIFANPDEIMNDDNYAYDAISFPVLADVAEAVARHAFTP